MCGNNVEYGICIFEIFFENMFLLAVLMSTHNNFIKEDEIYLPTTLFYLQLCFIHSTKLTWPYMEYFICLCVVYT